MRTAECNPCQRAQFARPHTTTVSPELLKCSLFSSLRLPVLLLVDKGNIGNLNWSRVIGGARSRDGAHWPLIGG